MQAYGYPTPPASPDCHDAPRSQPPIVSPQCQTRYVPVLPEDRVGMVLENRLHLTGILGTGAYGVVYSAVDTLTLIRYAVKCLSKFNADGTPLDRRQIAFQNREIRLHYRASSHPNVVSMLKIIDSSDCIYVILEYCPEGDLFFNITECGQYVGKDELSRSVFLQILDAVQHCHGLGIYHRDLKPENILVSDNGKTVKLADFGLATSSELSADYGCGSTFYMSPECLDQSTSKRNAFYMCAPNDVWSLGVVLVNLTCGRNPWKHASMDDATYRAFSRCPSYLKSILPVSDELNDILARIFTANPSKRITLPELRARIVACARLTTTVQAPLLPQPSAPAPEQEYFSDVDEYYSASSISPIATTSNAPTLDTVEELDVNDESAVALPLYNPKHQQLAEPQGVDQSMSYSMYPGQEFDSQPYMSVHSMVMPIQPAAMPPHQASSIECQPRSSSSIWYGLALKFTPVAGLTHHNHFPSQISFLQTFVG